MTPGVAVATATGDAYAALGSTPGGLTPDEAAARARLHGPNVLPQPRGVSALRRAVAQVTHPMALLLWAAGALAFLAGLPELGWAIVAVVLLNGAFGFVQEHRAERAVAALEVLLPGRARVVRAGAIRELDARDVVPGDVLVLEEGDRVSADATVVEAALLRLDLSLVTGESLPVDRRALSAGSDVRRDAEALAPAGATVVSGRARAVVFAIGAATELGRVARLSTASRRPASTLELQVRGLVRLVTAVAVAMAVGVYTILTLLGMHGGESLLFAIGILVANVPEGLLPAVTITLAANVQRIARRKAVVARLSALDALGAVDVICTDKTGTLTRNQLSLAAIWTPGARRGPEDGAAPPLALRLAALANDARRVADGFAGDPLDRALAFAAAERGLDPDALRRALPRAVELPFDARRRRMTVVVPADATLAPFDRARFVAVTKGAPDAVLDRCRAAVRDGAEVALAPALRAEIERAEDALAERGLRVVAVAARAGDAALPRAGLDGIESALVFAGLLAFEDPPRPGVRQSLARCRAAGIAVTIVTGDHGRTARTIAEQVGLWTGGARLVEGAALDALDDAGLERLLAEDGGLVFARVAPEAKLRLVKTYQRLGHVVAVTGDGVNDAPALHAADVGVAMGASGTDVARAAADVVLLDDDFSTIVAAVEEGRATFANVRKFLTYVLTSNVPEIVPFVAMVALRIPPALTILQILAIDLGTDMLPALALGAEPPEPGTLAGPPRSRTARLLDARVLARAYGLLGVVEAAACMAAFLLVWRSAGFDLADVRAATAAVLAHAVIGPVGGVFRLATTAALSAIVWCQVGNVLACRSERLPVTRLGVPPRLVRWGVAAELALLAAVVYAPPLQHAFGTAALAASAWPWLALGAPAVLVADAAWKAVGSRRRRAVSTSRARRRRRARRRDRARRRRATGTAAATRPPTR